MLRKQPYEIASKCRATDAVEKEVARIVDEVQLVGDVEDEEIERPIPGSSLGRSDEARDQACDRGDVQQQVRKADDQKHRD